MHSCKKEYQLDFPLTQTWLSGLYPCNAILCLPPLTSKSILCFLNFPSLPLLIFFPHLNSFQHNSSTQLHPSFHAIFPIGPIFQQGKPEAPHLFPPSTAQFNHSTMLARQVPEVNHQEDTSIWITGKRQTDESRKIYRKEERKKQFVSFTFYCFNPQTWILVATGSSSCDLKRPSRNLMKLKVTLTRQGITSTFCPL